MSVRTRFNERVNQMSFGEVSTYGASLFGGEIAGLALGGTVVLDSINNESVYQPLQDRVIELHRHNEQIRGAIDNGLFKGYGGKVAVETFLNHEASGNVTKIKALQAREPAQLSAGTGIGIFLGIGLAGAVAGTAAAYGIRKTVNAARSRFGRTESTDTP